MYSSTEDLRKLSRSIYQLINNCSRITPQLGSKIWDQIDFLTLESKRKQRLQQKLEMFLMETVDKIHEIPKSFLFFGAKICLDKVFSILRPVVILFIFNNSFLMTTWLSLIQPLCLSHGTFIQNDWVSRAKNLRQILH